MTGQLEAVKTIDVSNLEIAIKTAEVDCVLKNKNHTFQKVTNYIKAGIEAYFRPKSFEHWKHNAVYRTLGVHQYKKILPTCGDYVSRWIGYHPITKAKSRERGLIEYEIQTRVYETIHAIGAPIYLVSMIHDISNKDWGVAVYMLVANLAVNIYPIMVQR